MATYVIDTDSGQSPDYTSLSSHAALNRDLVSLAETDSVECRATSGLADTNFVNYSNSWTTSGSYYIDVWTASGPSGHRHDGKWNTNKYRIEHTAAYSYNDTFRCHNVHIKVRGLQIKSTAASYDYIHTILLTEYLVSSKWVYIEQCILRAAYSGTQTINFAIFHNNYTSYPVTLYVSNTIIYDYVNSTATNGAVYLQGNYTAYLYYLTAQNCYKGYYRGGGGTSYTYNCIFQDGDDGWYKTGAGNWEGDYNCSDLSADAPGGNSVVGEVTFVSEGSDFHVSSGDTVVLGNGYPLHADGNYPVSVDIDGNTRDTSTPDIGADEVTGAAPSETFFENRHPIEQGMKPQTASGMGGVLIEDRIAA